MRIVAVATHKERMFHLFKKSAEKHSIPLDILGMGQPWKGFGWRWTLIGKHLKHIDKDEIILVTDAFDSIILKDANYFEETFKSYNTSLLFSKEPSASEFFFPARYYRWRVFGDDPIINGGSYIGKAGAILSLINHLKYKNNTDDQRFLSKLNKMIKMPIDNDFKLIYHDVAWRRKSKLPDTGMISFPAGGYTKEVLKSLGYDYKNEEETCFEAFNLALRRIVHYTPYFWREILIFITIATGLTLPIFLGLLV